jgi:hypothetical protein
MTTKGPRASERHHGWLDDRSRALHLRVAEKLRSDPALISRALDNLDRWESRGGPDRVFDEWRRILSSRSVGEVIALLCENSENANRLRQSSPSAGILTDNERMEVFREYAAL